jgi:serine/threonine protein kinase HipA of HipAB toxin-antitoxin module
MQTGNAVMASSDRLQRYPAMAERAALGDVPGSSAGGEQPKFSARVATPDGVRSVLVKFTAPTSTPAGQRWADLLLAEWHALDTLRSETVSASKSAIIDAGGRRFLEVERFDRVGDSGRRGVISLGAVEAALLETAASTWIPASYGLEATRLLERESAEQLRRLASFGELIANTDMHPGNVGFWFGDGVPFQLAPAYDMLPMFLAPTTQGELVPRDFAPRPPSPELLPEWTRACHWALGYWQRIRDDGRFSRDFTGHADRCHQMVARLRDRFAVS